METDMKRNIDEILNKCKEEIRNGSSIKDCVAKHGSQIPDLESMLRSLQLLNSAYLPAPNEARKRKTRERLLLEFEQEELNSTQENASLSNIRDYPKGSIWRNYPVVVRVMVGVLTIFAICGLTLTVAGNSLPGSPFYPVKRMAETARINMAQNDTDKGILYVAVTQARIYEYEALQLNNPSRKVLKEDIKKDLGISETLALKNARVRAALKKMRDKNKGTLLSVFHITSNNREDDTKNKPVDKQSIMDSPEKQKANSGNAKGLIKKDAVSSTSTTLKWKTNQDLKGQNRSRRGNSNSTSVKTSTCTTNYVKADASGNVGNTGNRYRKGPSVEQNQANCNNSSTTLSNSASTTTGSNISNSNETQGCNGSNNQSQVVDSVDAQSVVGSTTGGNQNSEGGNGSGDGQNANGVGSGGSGSGNGQGSGSGYRYRGGRN
jgi:hypothetical protein